MVNIEARNISNAWDKEKEQIGKLISVRSESVNLRLNEWLWNGTAIGLSSDNYCITLH